MTYVKKRTSSVVLSMVGVIMLNYLLELSEYVIPVRLSATFAINVLIIIWGHRVSERITHARIRRNLVGISIALFALFFLRMCRYAFLVFSPTAERYLWYLFYVPLITVPLMSYKVALCVGRDETEHYPRHVTLLRIAASLLILLTVTNDLHSLVFKFGEDNKVSHRPVYFVIVLWILLLSIAVFRILILKCSLTSSKRNWYIPALLSGFGVILLGWYFIKGGSPMLFGKKLFKMQEAYAFIFISMLEGCMMIGLLPANSDYSRLFALSHINAELKNKNGEIKFCSHCEQDSGAETITRTKEISGGTVCWTEDVSAINRLNRELEQANELLREENDLIEEENRAAADRTRLETRNRLYDAIAEHTRAQLSAIDTNLGSAESFEQHAEMNLLLGTYIKRCANLMLIADGQERVSTEELALSVKESLESLNLFGVDCELICGTHSEFPAEDIIAAYDLFEAAAEEVCRCCSAFSVRISDGCLIKIETDGRLTEKRSEEKLRLRGLKAQISSIDGTSVIISEGSVK